MRYLIGAGGIAIFVSTPDGFAAPAAPVDGVFGTSDRKGQKRNASPLLHISSQIEPLELDTVLA